MKKILMILMVLSLFMSGCGVSDEENPVTGEGQRIIIEGKNKILKSVNEKEAVITGVPKRIVALDDSYLEMLTALEVYPVGGVGSLDDDSFPYYVNETLDEKGTEVVGNEGELDFEAIQGLEPDLIIGNSNNVEDYERLESIAPTVLWDDSDWRRTFEDVSVLLAEEEAFEKVMEEYDAKVSKINQSIKKDTSMLCIILEEDEIRMYHNNDEFLYEELHFVNPLEDVSGEEYDVLQSYFIIDADPNYMVVGVDSIKELEDFTNNNPGIVGIDAYKNENMYDVDSDLWEANGPISNNLKLNQIGTYLEVTFDDDIK